jgi:hypothetical protein
MNITKEQNMESQYVHKLELMTRERDEWRSRALGKGKRNIMLCAKIEKLEKQVEQLKKQIK